MNPTPLDVDSISAVATPLPARDVVFVSHAGPEDDAFAKWLALRLVGLGYRVWCDKLDLLGGEDFWSNIDTVIRERTAKVLFVLSRSSNQKPGPLKELFVAESVGRKHGFKDFIVPVRIDDIPYADANIHIARLGAIDFAPSWALGLRQVTTKLNEDHVPKHPDSNSSAVGRWWREQSALVTVVTPDPEDHYSNWFQLDLPPTIYRHTLTRDDIGVIEPTGDLGWPAVWTGHSLITFAAADAIAGRLAPLKIKETEEIKTDLFIQGGGRADKRRESQSAVAEMLNRAWDRSVQSRGLPVHEMSARRRAYYFNDTALPKDEVAFKGVNGKSTSRQLRGYRSLKSGKRFWIFAISAQPLFRPVPLFAIKPHVLFSDDEHTLWTSPDRMHSARRSQCKNWWNDEWRDRLLASMAWLSKGGDAFPIDLAPNVSAHVAVRPIQFTSPVTLQEPSAADESDEADELLVDDSDEDLGGDL